MKLSEIFDIRYGHSLELNRLRKTGPEGIPFVSRKMRDNGIAAYVAPVPGVEPSPAGELTCALSGNGVLSTFVQERPYYTAFHVACLRPKTALSTQKLLYYCVCIRANRYRYSYGRQANRSLRDISVPAPSEIPSWVDEYEVDSFAAANAPVTSLPVSDLINGSAWASFRLEQLFEVRKGKRLTKADQVPGSTRFIGAIDKNNGFRNYIQYAPIHEANTITVNYNGNGVAEAFYQPEPYWASDDVNVLYPKFPMNVFRALFITTLIRKEKYRFSYGRKWHAERMRESRIRLPTTSDGSPDWEYMETYIKSLPYSSQL